MYEFTFPTDSQVAEQILIDDSASVVEAEVDIASDFAHEGDIQQRESDVENTPVDFTTIDVDDAWVPADGGSAVSGGHDSTLQTKKDAVADTPVDRTASSEAVVAVDPHEVGPEKGGHSYVRVGQRRTPLGTGPERSWGDCTCLFVQGSTPI